MDPAWVSRLAHPLIVGITLPLTLLCAWLRRRRAPRPENEALLLLVLLLLLRCALDPWDNWYYPLPFLLALLVWETLSTDRAPVLALLASAGVWFLTQWAVPSHGFSDDAQALLFMAMAVPASFAIIAGLYVPGFGQRLGVR